MENKSIYHYTGSLGLLGIIKDQTIRCTNLKFLNDREEYNYLYSVYVKRHKDDTNGLLERLKDGNKNMKELYKIVYDSFGMFIELNQRDSYAACFTTNNDSIQNWMAYGRNPVNYSIEYAKQDVNNATLYCGRSNQKKIVDKLCGVRENELIAGSELLKYFVPRFCKVEYGAEHFPDKVFSKFLSDILSEMNAAEIGTDGPFNKTIESKFSRLYNEMIFSFSSTKKEEWKHENEYRIVLSESTIFDGNKTARKTGACDFISWRDSNGMLIPFANFPISRRLIKSVTYLAQNNPQRVKESLELLRSLYELDFEIKESECSLVI
ncbi:DUF2971 domain-containing protein [Klebsiella variicola]|uniref:DUF2971 domain-containing protein n=1 Tax=Klebsiella variicola TaxID=244366 RepID=UPI0007661AF0|nr:DUF2971 domain-containing protein [Klebsiella variicola]